MIQNSKGDNAMLVIIFCLLIATFVFFLGWNFQHGKLLFLIAGNSNYEVPRNKQKLLGKLVSYCMYVAGISILILGWMINSDISDQNKSISVYVLALIFFLIEISMYLYIRKRMK